MRWHESGKALSTVFVPSHLVGMMVEIMAQILQGEVLSSSIIAFKDRNSKFLVFIRPSAAKVGRDDQFTVLQSSQRDSPLCSWFSGEC